VKGGEADGEGQRLTAKARRDRHTVKGGLLLGI
jgi:hypothetical protein